MKRQPELIVFQSPFHRGNGCYLEPIVVPEDIVQFLSVPFSSGQWLLHPDAKNGKSGLHSFSPLFIGAMVATTLYGANADDSLRTLSVPFSSGQWLLR